MPTGYTAPIKDGITFEQFALGCARAFGALVLMRDEPSDAPIPDRFEPSDYHTKAIAEARAELARLDAMSLGDAAIAAENEHLAAIERYRTRLADKRELRRKYEAMLAKVEAWEPPTPEHVEYKNFMRSQIAESIDWDCCEKYDTEPKATMPREWLAEKIAAVRKNIEYHQGEHAKEVARTESRNVWLKALRDSLLSV